MHQDDTFLRDAESQIARGLPGAELMHWAKEQHEGTAPDLRQRLVSRLQSLAAAAPCKPSAVTLP